MIVGPETMTPSRRYVAPTRVAVVGSAQGQSKASASSSQEALPSNRCTRTNHHLPPELGATIQNSHADATCTAQSHQHDHPITTSGSRSGHVSPDSSPTHELQQTHRCQASLVWPRADAPPMRTDASEFQPWHCPHSHHGVVLKKRPGAAAPASEHHAQPARMPLLQSHRRSSILRYITSDP